MFVRKSLVVFIVQLLTYSFCYKKKVLDLTWEFNENTIYWDGSQTFNYTKVTTGDPDFWMAMNEFCAAEHGGTHMDAPYQFNKHGWKAAEIPIERFMVPGCLIDVKDEVAAAGGADFLLQLSHLEKWEKDNGPFPEGSVLIIRYGWSQYYHNRTEFLGLVGKQMNFPGISADASEWIANAGKFYGIAVDTSSGDASKFDDFITHRLLMDKQMYIVESLKLVEDLPAKDFTMIMLPMKLTMGSGTPLRALAVFDKLDI